MRKQVLIYLAIYACIYAIALVAALLTKPTFFSNILGLVAILNYICSLSPGIFRIILPSSRKNKFLNYLLKHRRFVGISAFLLALNHGVLQIIKRQLNLLDPLTYLHYFQGFSMLTILTLLAITSSDESVKSFKRNWKKLHQLTYLIIFLLPWHIVDKMSGHWTFITPISVLLSLLLVTLFLIRKHKESLNISSA
ncbi:MAG: iron reductase [Acaryochloridaceae cyanobacterium CSU_3_4]|nr:iron reductase [Acaryochloridaceae cyanobacterium CSU_3_4]